MGSSTQYLVYAHADEVPNIHHQHHRQNYHMLLPLPLERWCDDVDQLKVSWIYLDWSYVDHLWRLMLQRADVSSASWKTHGWHMRHPLIGVVPMQTVYGWNGASPLDWSVLMQSVYDLNEIPHLPHIERHRCAKTRIRDLYKTCHATRTTKIISDSSSTLARRTLSVIIVIDSSSCQPLLVCSQHICSWSEAWSNSCLIGNTTREVSPLIHLPNCLRHSCKNVQRLGHMHKLGYIHIIYIPSVLSIDTSQIANGSSQRLR